MQLIEKVPTLQKNKTKQKTSFLKPEFCALLFLFCFSFSSLKEIIASEFTISFSKHPIWT